MITDEHVVREILKPYENDIRQAVYNAWTDFKELNLSGRLLFPSRSRACLVYDFMVKNLMSILDSDKNVRVILRDETVKFVFADQVLMRLKKADDRGLGSNIPTQASLDFIGQQLEIPGMPDVQKIEVVYQLNSMQTQIDSVEVVARDGNYRLWGYDIDSSTQADVIQLPLTPVVEPEKVRVKLRKVKVDKTKKIGE